MLKRYLIRRVSISKREYNIESIRLGTDVENNSRELELFTTLEEHIDLLASSGNTNVLPDFN